VVGPPPGNERLFRPHRVDPYKCPSDSDFPDASFQNNINYYPNAGPNFQNVSLVYQNGSFRRDRETAMRDIRDGTSGTFLLAEVGLGDNTGSRFSYVGDMVRLPGGGLATGTTVDEFVPLAQMEAFGLACEAGISGPGYSTGGRRYHVTRADNAQPFSGLAPPNWKYPNCTQSDWSTGRIFKGARSYHPGGAMHSMSDASVRFITETIDFDTYQALGGREEGTPAEVPGG
jgi:hypothetical protein